MPASVLAEEAKPRPRPASWPYESGSWRYRTPGRFAQRPRVSLRLSGRAALPAVSNCCLLALSRIFTVVSDIQQVGIKMFTPRIRPCPMLKQISWLCFTLVTVP